MDVVISHCYMRYKVEDRDQRKRIGLAGDVWRKKGDYIVLKEKIALR